MKEGVVKKLVWFFLTLLGVAVVVSLAPAMAAVLTLQAGLSPQMVLMIEVVLIIVIALFSWLITGPIIRGTVAVTKRLEGTLQKMSTQDLLSGAIGLIIGLIIAFFIGNAVSNLPIIGPIVAVVAYVILGYLGLSLGMRKREDLATLVAGLGKENNRFKVKGKTRAAGYCNMPKVLDTSVIIDGRIADICKT